MNIVAIEALIPQIQREQIKTFEAPQPNEPFEWTSLHHLSYATASSLPATQGQRSALISQHSPQAYEQPSA
ncbi:MAG: hypothetical protein ACK6AD_11115 [Cyanobacteriota bacterium]|jgi:hypothetical protein